MTKNTRPTQAKQILNWLKQGHSLTGLDALRRFGCFRLGARIYELKKQNYPITKKMVTHTIYGQSKTYASYRMGTLL